jgi:hypothetical protein
LSETINGAFNVIEEHLSKKQQSFWGRIVKGDTIECVFDSPQYALWSALAKRYENVPGMQLYAQVQQTIKH